MMKARADAKPGWVLVVDDHDDGRELLTEFLASRGLVVESCASAEEALERVAAKGAPGVVITDLTLGSMSGTELARRLRQGNDTAATPILAVTGHVHVDDPEQLFAQIFAKPVPLAELTEAVDRALAA
jgi:CheY-like chemotaxis protein